MVTPHQMSCVQKVSQGDSKEPCLKCRYIVVLIGFWIYLLTNSLCLHMSVSILAMVNNSAISSTTVTSDSCPTVTANGSDANELAETDENWKAGEFVWSPKLQGYILGSLLTGFVVFQIPGGMLCERFGCKRLLFTSLSVTALTTLLLPLAARLNVYCLITLQTIRGLSLGVIQPAGAVLAANWFPIMERGLLYPLILSGLSAGSVMGSALAGFLCDSFGWSFSFYIFGAALAILALCVGIFLYESPKYHPRISKAELEYITNNQENALTRKRPIPPWSKMFTSVPVYALMIAYFGRFWALSQFLLVQSTYLGTILHYPIKQNGFFSAAPFILQFVCSHISSWSSSFMTQKNCASVDHIRKFWNFLSCLGYAASVLGIYFAGCNASISVFLGIISMGFNGFAYSGCVIVPNDMSPTFAGTLHAIACTFGASSGLIVPVTIGYLTNEQQTIEQWNTFMFISAGVVMSSGIIFSLFGSAEVQPWNYKQEEKENRKKEVTRF